MVIGENTAVINGTNPFLGERAFSLSLFLTFKNNVELLQYNIS